MGFLLFPCVDVVTSCYLSSYSCNHSVDGGARTVCLSLLVSPLLMFPSRVGVCVDLHLSLLAVLAVGRLSGQGGIRIPVGAPR